MPEGKAQLIMKRAIDAVSGNQRSAVNNKIVMIHIPQPIRAVVTAMFAAS